MTGKTRIWVYWNEWTKITLRKNEYVRMWRGGQTDEGYECIENIYKFDGEWIYCYEEQRGRDCDGPYEHYTQKITHYLNKESGENWVVPNKWKVLDSRQRDYFAEKMGY